MPGGAAEVVWVPESEADVVEILRDASTRGVKVTVAGARTGTVGGAVPFGGGVISMERLSKIKSIDGAAKLAVVEPGVILGDLQKAVEADGLFYPPDPTEWSCQIGGTVATNASGSRSFKYGATREFVEGLRVVLGDGDVLVLRRGESEASDGSGITLTTEGGREIRVPPLTYERPDVRKNVSGYYNARPLDPIDLFIGSEGTLGVITEVTLRLIDKPAGHFSGIVFFPDQADMLAFADEVRRRSFAARAGDGVLDATLVEYFDDRALSFIKEKFADVPDAMAGAIFFEQETTPESEDAVLEEWNELIERHNAAADSSWFATTDGDLERMREFRHASPVAVNERVVRNKQKKIGTDMAVPDANFPAFLRFYKKTLEAAGIEYVIFGHIGDCHLHANLLPRDDDEAERARHIYSRCVAQALMLGGCVSAEHGIGKLKRKFLDVMMGERYLNEMADVKRAFDARGLLGDGNMFAADLVSRANL